MQMSRYDDWQEQDEMVMEALGDAALGRGGEWFRANCPFCLMATARADKRYSLGVKVTGTYHCSRCGTSGRLREVPESFVGLSKKHAKAEAAGPTEVPLPTNAVPLWRGPGLDASTLHYARRYLRKRGFGRAAWTAAELHAVHRGEHQPPEGPAQQVRSRIVAPVIASDGRTLFGWVGRDWTGLSVRKYLYPVGMMRGSILYNHCLLHEQTDEPVLIVEGVFDTLPYPHRAVACLGKPSKWQQEALKVTRRPVAVCLDGDAWEEGYALAMSLRLEGVRTGFVRLPPKQDPADVDPQWLMEEARRCLDD